jgi:lysophospholipase L1-like esterase
VRSLSRFVATFLLASCTRGDSTAAPTRPPVPLGEREPAPPRVAAAVPAAAAAPASPGGAAPTAPASTARLAGRFDVSDPSAPRFAWPGTAVTARFKGTSITAHLKEDGASSTNLYEVLVDGERTRVLKTSKDKTTYVLAESLADGTHEVTLYKRTEARVGEAVFLGFETPGQLLPAPPAPARRIEIIGDSITTGYGIEAANENCTFRPEDENEYLTYGALTARALGADHVTIAWSGKTIKEMTEYYERTLPAREDSKWDFTAWIPQVVVVNVGTNNFATYDPGETRFVFFYTKLVARVREVYPNAFIVCALGPMLSDNYPTDRKNLTQAKRYMRTAMAKLKADDARIEYLEFPEQNHANGLGCGWHPSKKTNQLMSERLVPLLREKLGW